MTVELTKINRADGHDSLGLISGPDDGNIIRKPLWAYLFGLVIFSVFFAFSLQYKCPVYLSDEMGYLSKAAALSGYVTDRPNQWYAGYSLILAPLFRIFSDPFTIWKGVLFLNAAMCGFAFIMLYYVLIYVFPHKNDARIFGAMSICAIYPAFITMSGYAFASSAFSFFFMLVLVTLPKCWGERYLRWCFFNAFLVGYLSWIHPTALGVAAAYTILFLFYKRNWRSFAVQVMTVWSMAVIYKVLLHPWLNSAMTLGFYTGEKFLAYPSIKEIIFHFTDIRSFAILFAHLFGKYVYFTMATLGMFHSFLIDFYHRIKNNYQYIISAKAIFFAPIFVIMSFLFITAISAIAFSTNYNKDVIPFTFLLYGRYSEHVFLPFLGFLLLYSYDKFKLSSSIIILLSGYFYWNPFFEVSPDFNPVCLTAYWPVIFFKDNFYTAALASTLIVLSARYMKKKFVNIMLIVLYAICIFHQKDVHLRTIEVYSKPSEFISYIRETFPRGSLVAFDAESRSQDFRESYPLYAYYLYDYDYRTMTKDEWNEASDGVYLTYTPVEHGDADDFTTALEYRSYLYMIIKKHSLVYPFNYKQKKSWLTKAVFAKSFNDDIVNNSYHDAEELPTAVGQKNNDSLFTAEKRGYLVFGPYRPRKAGQYRLTIKGQIYSLAETGDAVVDVVSEIGERQHALFKLNSFTPSDDTIFQDTFILNEDAANLEVRIFVGEQDNLRFDSYTIEKYGIANAFYHDAEELPTIVGKRNDAGLFTAEKRGHLIYGPYRPMKAGQYRLTIKGQIYSLAETGDAVVDVVSEIGERQHALFRLDSFTPSDDTIFQDTFILNEDATDLEVRIFVGEQDNLRFDSYTIEKVER